MLKLNPLCVCIHVISSPWRSMTVHSPGSVYVLASAIWSLLGSDCCLITTLALWCSLLHAHKHTYTHMQAHTKTFGCMKHNTHTHICTHGHSCTLHSYAAADTDTLAHSCTCPHAYASCVSCYYTILQVMNQSICLQSVLKWERDGEKGEGVGE